MSQQHLGKYSVLRRLGAGGMAEVFLCKLQGIGGFEKHVVLKRIREDAANDVDLRVVSPAALDVPFSPGSPV